MIRPSPSTLGQIHLADNLLILRQLPTASIPLIYIDPPFNTQKTQKRDRITATRDPQGTRSGFAEARYTTTRIASAKYEDTFDDFLAFMTPRLEEAHRILTPDGSLFLHIDYREVHYLKVLLDRIFGRASFINEIIWAYDYGGKPKKRWPAKHDNILWYAKNSENTSRCSSRSAHRRSRSWSCSCAPGWRGPRQLIFVELVPES